MQKSEIQTSTNTIDLGFTQAKQDIKDQLDEGQYHE